MRLPTYENQVRAPNAPQYSAMVDLSGPSSLSQLADGLQNYSEYRQKELEEAQKTEWYKADNGFRLDMANAKSEMINTIQNGGSYADAEAKFQKTYEDTKAKYMPFFGADKNVSARQEADFERVGLEGLLNIREAVQQRRKSDAVDTTNLMLSKIDEEINGAMIAGDFKLADQLISKIPSQYAAATSVGVISQDEAKLKIQEKISNTKSKFALFAAETNPEFAGQYLQNSYDKKEVLSSDYMMAYPKILDAIKKDKLKKQAYVSLYNEPTSMNDEDVEAVVEEESTKSGVQPGSKEYTDTVGAVSSKAKKLPPSVINSIRSTLSMNPDMVTKEQADELSRYAIMLQSVPDIAISKMSDEDKAAINFIASQTSQGADVVSTVKNTLKNRSEDFVKNKKELASISNAGLDNSKYLAEKLDWNWAWRRLGYEVVSPTKEHIEEFDSLFAKYRNKGMRTIEAREMAYKDFRSIYSANFNWFSDEASLSKTGTPFLEEKMDKTFVERLLPGKQAFAPTGEMQEFFDNQVFNYWNASGKTSLSDAQNMALRDVYEIWGEYDGEIIKRPPSMMGYSDKQFKQLAIETPLKNAGLYQDGVKYKIGHDLVTESQYQNGDRSLTYPIIYENEFGVMVPLTKEIIDKDGNKKIVQVRTSRIRVKEKDEKLKSGVERLM